jgi:hypothetical protein
MKKKPGRKPSGARAARVEVAPEPTTAEEEVNTGTEIFPFSKKAIEIYVVYFF